MMTIVIAGERSGTGKTTIALSILATMVSWQKSIQSFKIGPDYIDPMYHTQTTGLPCRNLDPVLTSENYVIQCFYRYCNQYSLIEGVMGLFDGAGGMDDYGSTAHVAKILQLPIVLVINCSSISRSVAAIVHGYNTFDANVKIKGIILNYLSSERHLEIITQAVSPLNIPIIGKFWRDDQIAIPGRYLGLVPSGELDSFAPVIDRLTQLGKKCLDWDLLLPLLSSPQVSQSIPRAKNKLKIAIARDEAFNFYYADNLDLLQETGIELISFSPLHDRCLPDGISGLYFGGGFPELWAEQLSSNLSLIHQIQTLIRSGIPTYAECGGLMYLTRGIIDNNHKFYATLGIIPAQAIMTSKLTLGYRLGIADQGSFLCHSQEQVWGHEFHRSVLSDSNPCPLFQLHRYNSQLSSYGEGWGLPNLHASYLHLHFGDKQVLIQRLFNQCFQFHHSRNADFS